MAVSNAGDPAMVEVANTRGSSTGRGLRHCCQMNRTAVAGLPADEAGGSEDQGAVAPHQRVDRQAQRSRQQGDARRDPVAALPCRSASATSSARQAAPGRRGFLQKKIQRQPNHAARKPPGVGPSAMATPEITP